MKNKLFFIVLIGMVIFGCKSTKQTITSGLKSKIEANLQVNQSDNFNIDVNKSISDQTSLIAKKSTADKGTTNETVEETNTTTKLSAPDSTGKQYPTEINTTNRKITRGENKNLITDLSNKSDVTNKTDIQDKSKLKTNTSLKDKVKAQTDIKSSDKKTEEIKTPGWVYVAIIVLSVAFLLIVYLILKRFNLIK